MNTVDHILIVDDDAVLRNALRGLFEIAGYRVTEAADGREALAALGNDPLPDVILLDIEMPRMNGVTFRLHQLHEPRIAGVPVVIYSFTPDSTVLAGIMQASAFLAKPADDDVLLAAVQRVVHPR